MPGTLYDCKLAQASNFHKDIKKTKDITKTKNIKTFKNSVTILYKDAISKCLDKQCLSHIIVVATGKNSLICVS